MMARSQFIDTDSMEVDFKHNTGTLCPRLWSSTFIDEKGDVYPCCHRPGSPLGNIKHKPLEDVWLGRPYAKSRKDAEAGRLGCYATCNIIDRSHPPTQVPERVTYGDLETIHIQLGQLCNLACVMCRQDHGDLRSISLEALKSRIEARPGVLMKVQGGEPLMFKSLALYMDEMGPRGVRFAFVTNGTLINSRWADRIARYCDQIEISINGSNAAVHEMVNVGSKWTRVKEGIERLLEARRNRDSKMTILVHMTIIEDTVGDIPHFIDAAPHLGVDGVTFGFDRKVPAKLASAPELQRRCREAIARALKRVPDGFNVDLLRLKMLGLA